MGVNTNGLTIAVRSVCAKLEGGRKRLRPQRGYIICVHTTKLPRTTRNVF